MHHPCYFNKTTIACSVAAILFSPISLAATGTIDTDTVTVFGKAYRNTATKTSLTPEETPQAVTTITNDEIESRSATSLNQILRYAPGITTENKGGSVTMYDNYTIRGFSSYQSFYDGLVLQYLTGWNLQPQIDPFALEQVEIFKGPTSVLYGSMPPGGMVNMIAKSPQDVAHTEFDFSVGNRNLKKVAIDTTGPIGDGNLRYRMIASAKKRDSQIDYAEEERYLIAPSLDWQVSDQTLINFNAYYQTDPAMGINSSLPTLDGTSSSTSVGDVNWSQFQRDFVLLGYKFNHDFNDQWSFLQNVRYLDASLKQKNTYHSCYTYSGTYYCGYDESTGTLSRNIYSTEESSHGLVVDNQFTGFAITGQVEHNLLLGVDYQKLSGKSNYKEYSTSDSDFYTFNVQSPNNDLLDTSTLSTVYANTYDISLKQLGIYLQDQMRWDQWVFLTGLRWDHYKASSIDDASNSSTDQHNISYRVGALYEFNNGVSPYLSYATSFEPTTGTDADTGEAYKPETSSQWETGFKYQSPNRALHGSIAVYQIVKRDALVTNYEDYIDPELQVGEITSQGVELQIAWQPNQDWHLNTSYTYSDVEITQDSAYDLEGTTPIYSPKHSAKLWSSYRGFEGLNIDTGVRYIGSMQKDATNTQGKVPSYTLVDLSVGYDLSALSPEFNGISTRLSANNLFNKEYYTCYDETNCWYGEERTWEVNLKIEL